jgi:Capsule assembly protein Wzi
MLLLQYKKYSALFGIAVTSVLHAQTMIAPGDRRLREDLELLSDTGIIPGSTATWPLPVPKLPDGTALALNPAQQAALDRVRTVVDRANSEDWKISWTARATNGPALRRDFSDRARDEADLTLKVDKTLGQLDIHLQTGFRNRVDSSKINFDGSYAAINWGDWQLYAGFLDQWWGSSAEASVINSTNARPFPKAGFARTVSDPFETKWLSWIGPWRFEGFAGVLTGPRSDAFTNPILAGFRLTFQPSDHFEISLSRQLQLCGKGRPCGISTIAKSLFPIGFENTGSFNDPGNQTAGYEFRYHRQFGDLNAVIYFNTLAEDTIIQDLSVQLGGSLTGPSKYGTWRIGVEAVDTYARTFAGSNTVSGKVKGFNKRQPGVTALHFIYLDGISFRGRPLGFSLDGDTYLYTATASLTDTENRRWFGSLNRADINVTNTPRYRVSRTREVIWTAEAGVDWPTRFGDIALEGRYQSKVANIIGAERSTVQGEVRWTVQF